MAGRAPKPASPFSRRERQAMDAVFRLGRASVHDVRADMPDAPSYSAVRALMNVLVEKGHLQRKRQGRQFLYRPTVAPSRARRSAIKGVVDTFFAGSVESAIATLMDMRSRSLDPDELQRLADRIEAAQRNEGDA